jgi:hypothetical protein
MNFKRSLVHSLVTFFAVLFFVAAIQGYAVTVIQDNPDEDPRLFFTSMTEFDTYMDSIIEMSDEELDIQENSLNFYSMRKAMEESGNPQVGNDVEFVEYEDFVEDPYLASVLNRKGIIQIGTDVIVVTQYVVYRVPEIEMALIDSLDLFAMEVPPVLPGSIEGYLIEREEGLPYTLALTEGAMIQAGGNSYCYNNYASKRRLKGRTWITNWRFYASAGARAKSQQQKKILWWKRWMAKTVTYVQVYIQYYLTVLPVGTNVSGTTARIRYNASSATHIAAKASGWGVAITGTISSTLSLNNSGTIASCVVRLPTP